MSKMTTTADTYITASGSITSSVADTNIDSVIADMFKQLNPNWIYIAPQDSAGDISKRFFYLKRDATSTVGFRFSRYANGTAMNIEINPAIIYSNGDGFVDGTYKQVKTGRIFANPADVNPSAPLSCRYTICESKNKKAWMISVVDVLKTFDVYTSLVGIDSAGEPYAMNMGSVNNVYYQEFLSNASYINGCISQHNQGQTIQKIGFGPDSQHLSLVPLINPTNGAVCNDVYLPLSGPASTQLYNVTINGRQFVTGSHSNTADSLSSPTIEEYDCISKVFMEV